VETSRLMCGTMQLKRKGMGKAYASPIPFLINFLEHAAQDQQETEDDQWDSYGGGDDQNGQDEAYDHQDQADNSRDQASSNIQDGGQQGPKGHKWPGETRS
jgi:hypothetical protein